LASNQHVISPETTKGPIAVKSYEKKFGRGTQGEVWKEIRKKNRWQIRMPRSSRPSGTSWGKSGTTAPQKKMRAKGMVKGGWWSSRKKTEALPWGEKDQLKEKPDGY